MRARLFTEQVKLASAGQWDGVLQAVCGLTDDEVNPRKNNMPCPACGGRDRYSFMSIEDGNYICRQCGSGDGFSLMMKVLECSFTEAVEHTACYLGIERQSNSNQAQTTAQLARIQDANRERRQEQQQAEAREKQQQQAQAAQLADYRLATAKPASPLHPYLVRKQLPPLGLQQQGSLLLLGLYSHGHTLVNIEFINPQGKKFGLENGQRKGVYHRFGGDAWTVYVCEGWATGASIYLMDNQAVRVYAAMGKGNLETVAHIAREQNPESRLVLAADNDTHLINNPGLTGAIKVAEQVGALVMLPPAAASASKKGMDFSDFYLANGGLSYGSM